MQARPSQPGGDLQTLRSLQQGRRRRQLLAAVALVLAVVLALPDGIAQLAELPWASWLLAGVALALLWPRGSDG
tara:strand:+ start:53 stop:274 length:222 start_codon:yes stop_codon:yes gene_type:complete